MTKYGTSTAPCGDFDYDPTKPPPATDGFTWQCPFCKTVYTILQTSCHCQTDYTQFKPPVITCGVSNG